MSKIIVACPKCGKELKLRDPGLLGKRGKCPACEHRFVLEEQEEVEMELVDSAGASTAAVGTSAQWVPDSPQPPQSQEQTPPAFDPGAPTGLLLDDPERGGTSRLKEIRRKKRKNGRIGMLVGGVVALACVATVYWIRTRPVETQANDGKPKPTVDKTYVAEKETLKQNVSTAESVSPTQGEPFQLLYVPDGARMIFHLRPAWLWEKGGAGEEVRYCLGPIGEWLGAEIKELCLYEPAEIDRLLICVYLEARGIEPKVAAVVHLAEEQKRSAMVLKIQGERDDTNGYPVFKRGKVAYLIKDLQTFAVGPAAEAGQMVDHMNLDALPEPRLEELIPRTDRDRHFTMLMIPDDARIFDEFLLPENARPMLHEFLDWLGTDVEAVAWSAHFGEPFFSEVMLRNASPATPVQLEREMTKKLDRLPEELAASVPKMQPRELGKRKIIGRFPAMMEAFRLRTMGGIGDRFAQMTTALPERAGPNLVLAGLLAWDESTRTDFTKEAPKPKPTGPKLPDTIAERLRTLKLTATFTMPFQEAVEFIGEETRVEFDIDGDAFKDAGMTKNMKQELKLGEATGADVLYHITENYKREGMCVVVDEKSGQAIMTTRKFAEKNGQTPFDLKPKKE